jgi:filamentous hemagglutinin
MDMAKRLGTTTDGAPLAMVPAALEEIGVKGGQYVRGATLTDLENALSRGRSAIISVDVPGIRRHVIVADKIEGGFIFVRDPLPVGIGSAIGFPTDELKYFWTRSLVRF